METNQSIRLGETTAKLQNMDNEIVQYDIHSISHHQKPKLWIDAIYLFGIKSNLDFSFKLLLGDAYHCKIQILKCFTAVEIKTGL